MFHTESGSIVLPGTFGSTYSTPIGTYDTSSVQVAFLDPLFANIADNSKLLMEYFTEPIAQTKEWIDNLVTKWENSITQVRNFIDVLENFDLEEGFLFLVRKLNNTKRVPKLSTGADDEDIPELFLDA